MRFRVAADWTEGISRHNYDRTPKGWVEGDEHKTSAADMFDVWRDVWRISAGPCIKKVLCGR